jgi:hypothetical protein
LAREFDKLKAAEIAPDSRGAVSKTLSQLEKCRKACAARLAKTGRAEGAQARVALANLIERNFLDNRFDVDVRVKGKHGTTLWMRWIWNRVSIGDFEQGETISAIVDAGFEKIHYDSFTEYYTTTLSGADWGDKKVREAGLHRSFALPK